jgi:hypothetical protein
MSVNEKGLISQEKIEQKQPRGETDKGQRPKAKKETVKSDRGTFPMK